MHNSNYTYHKLYIKRANKIRRLRIKKAIANPIAVGTGVVGAGYGAYKGYQLGDAYANKWVTDDSTWYAPWLKGLIRAGGAIGGGALGFGAGYLAGNGLQWLFPKIGFGGALMGGSMVGQPVANAAVSADSAITSHANSINQNITMNRKAVENYLNGVSNVGSNGMAGTNYSLNSARGGRGFNNATGFNNYNYMNNTTPSFQSWKPST